MGNYHVFKSQKHNSFCGKFNKPIKYLTLSYCVIHNLKKNRLFIFRNESFDLGHLAMKPYLLGIWIHEAT